MADPLRFHPLVADDLRNATRWYDEISVELGNRFRVEADRRFDSIVEFAESFPIAVDNLRFARVRRDPYILLFQTSGELIHVLGLFHTASDPEKWRRRSVS